MLAHAPVILPALARVKLLFGWLFYVPLGVASRIPRRPAHRRPARPLAACCRRSGKRPFHPAVRRHRGRLSHRLANEALAFVALSSPWPPSCYPLKSRRARPRAGSRCGTWAFARSTCSPACSRRCPSRSGRCSSPASSVTPISPGRCGTRTRWCSDSRWPSSSDSSSPPGRNWSNQPTPTGWKLAALAALWVAGRVLVLTPFAVAAAVVNVAFPLLAAVSLAIPFVKAGNRRNYFFVGLLLLLSVAAGFVHLSQSGTIQSAGRARHPGGARCRAVHPRGDGRTGHSDVHQQRRARRQRDPAALRREARARAGAGTAGRRCGRTRGNRIEHRGAGSLRRPCAGAGRCGSPGRPEAFRWCGCCTWPTSGYPIHLALRALAGLGLVAPSAATHALDGGRSGRTHHRHDDPHRPRAHRTPVACRPLRHRLLRARPAGRGGSRWRCRWLRRRRPSLRCSARPCCGRRASACTPSAIGRFCRVHASTVGRGEHGLLRGQARSPGRGDAVGRGLLRSRSGFLERRAVGRARARRRRSRIWSTPSCCCRR